jgi:Xaa-Pro aminopeptidase
VHVLCGENPFVQAGEGAAFIDSLRAILPLHILERAAPRMGALRAVKNAEELTHIRRAAVLAADGMRRAVGFVRPGVRGYEIKAEYLHSIMSRGSAGWGCPPITACGAETLLLHWLGDRSAWTDGALAVLDFTAESAGWHADVARCIPVSGRFTPRQRQMHDEVHRLLRECTALLEPGRTLLQCQAAGEKLVKAAADRMGLSPGLVPHRIFHHAGMEVHDPVPDSIPLAQGAVIAVEPGLYSTADGCGIRLEDTVALTSSGLECLTAAIPADAGGIEALMLG